MKKQISTALAEANIAKVMALLADTPAKLQGLSAGLSDERLNQPLVPAERSFKENLAHLINCEARSAEAITLALLADEPLLPKIHPEQQLGKLMTYARFPFSDLLTYFTLRRTFLLSVLNRITQKQWARTIRTAGKKRQESVYWQARALALHELEHLLEIERKLSEGNSPGTV